MGISRDSWHKRRATGARQNPIRMKRKFELGRPAAMTKLAPKRVHVIRTRGGNRKFRALRLDTGNFSWASEATTFKTRIIDVVYNASNNELVRTKTLVKNCIVQIDATPFKKWFQNHYAKNIGVKKGKAVSEADEAIVKKTRSNHLQRKIASREAMSKIDPKLDEQFATGRLYACISSRPGQCGRADGYILEGKELEFYLRKLKSKRGH
jgi:small subunit ribosomal protein S8e